MRKETRNFLLSILTLLATSAITLATDYLSARYVGTITSVAPEVGPPSIEQETQTVEKRGRIIGLRWSKTKTQTGPN